MLTRIAVIRYLWRNDNWRHIGIQHPFTLYMSTDPQTRTGSPLTVTSNSTKADDRMADVVIGGKDDFWRKSRSQGKALRKKVGVLPSAETTKKNESKKGLQRQYPNKNNIIRAALIIALRFWLSLLLSTVIIEWGLNSLIVIFFGMWASWCSVVRSRYNQIFWHTRVAFV